MRGIRWIVAVVGVVFLVAGVLAYWVVPWASVDLQDTTRSFIGFLVTLFGFIVTIYRLRATEISILKSIQKPALQLEILPSSGRPEEHPGRYAGKKIEENTRLLLYPVEGSTVGTRIALRIQNVGDKAASRVWLTFVFKRKGMPKAKEIGKLDIYYHEGQQNYRSQVKYWDYDLRPDFELSERQSGLTFKFSEDFVIHADKTDRAVLAEVDLRMNRADFEAEFEVHYRIQSYEGNSLLEALKDKKTGEQNNQRYPITFEIAGTS